MTRLSHNNRTFELPVKSSRCILLWTCCSPGSLHWVWTYCILSLRRSFNLEYMLHTLAMFAVTWFDLLFRSSTSSPTVCRFRVVTVAPSFLHPLSTLLRAGRPGWPGWVTTINCFHQNINVIITRYLQFFKRYHSSKKLSLECGLPLHAFILQSLSWKRGPSQFFPPFAGAGLVQ